MSLFTVNPEKCKRDGICVAECPLALIKMGRENELPFPVEGAEHFCVDCGHCVAVCPQGAIAHRAMRPEECEPFRKELLPGAEQVRHFLSSRRSIRVYKDRPVARDVLKSLIDTAAYAPSGHNLQPVNWLVIESTVEVRRLSAMVIDWMRLMLKEKPEVALPMHMDKVVEGWENGKDRICRGAPHIILAHARKDLSPARDACTIALTYLELTAYSMGLGACWAGYFGVAAALFPPLSKALGLPENHQACGAMMIGYPIYQYQRIPLRKNPEIAWR